MPLRGNSPPVPDRKYLSGCKSSAAALCRAQPPKAALGAELCDLYAKGVQIVRAADCNPFVKKGQSPFLTVSALPKGEPRVLHPGKFPFTCCMPVPDAHCPVEAQEAAGQGFVLHPDGAPAVNETFHFKDGESSEEVPRQNRPQNIFRTIREKGEFDLFFTWGVFRILHGGDKMGA